MLSHFSHVWFFMALWTVACQDPLSMGFSRQKYWSGLPCPPPELADGFFTTKANCEAHPSAHPWRKLSQVSKAHLAKSYLSQKCFKIYPLCHRCPMGFQHTAIANTAAFEHKYKHFALLKGYFWCNLQIKQRGWDIGRKVYRLPDGGPDKIQGDWRQE